MKLFTTGLDANGRSTLGLIEVPLTKISETEAISAEQPGVYWYIVMSNGTSRPRTDKDFDAPGGAFEAHTGGLPHMPVVMTGSWDTTLQDGKTCRFAPGDIHVTRAGAQHQTNLHSSVPMTMIVVYLPGTSTDINAYSAASDYAPLNVKK
jgi:mannose-6-phosphate isomerase-like protein (cupin superfamily)